MKTIEQLYQDFDQLLDTLGIPKEPPKGSFYDLTSTDEPPNADAEDPVPVLADNAAPANPPKRKRGGQPGNQNARKHGLYSKYLTPEQQMEFEEALKLHNPYREIALMRVKINAVLADPTTSPEVLIKAIHAFARLISIERRYLWR